MHVIILGLCDCEGSQSKNLSKTHSYTSIQTRGCKEFFYKPWNLRYFCCCWWLTNLTDSLHETTKDSAIGLVTCDLLPVICLQKTSFLADTTCTWTIFPNRWLSQSKNTATVCRTIHAWNTFDVIFFLVWFKLNGLNKILYREHLTSLEGASFSGYFFPNPLCLEYWGSCRSCIVCSALHAWLVCGIAKKTSLKRLKSEKKKKGNFLEKTEWSSCKVICFDKNLRPVQKIEVPHASCWRLRCFTYCLFSCPYIVLLYQPGWAAISPSTYYYCSR